MDGCYSFVSCECLRVGRGYLVGGQKKEKDFEGT